MLDALGDGGCDCGRDATQYVILYVYEESLRGQRNMCEVRRGFEI